MRQFLSHSLWFCWIALVSCSGNPDILPPTNVDRAGHVECQKDARTDRVTAATWNMAIGFDVSDLLFLNLDSLRVIHSRTEKMLGDAVRALPRLRIHLMAQEIASNHPDVVGLQETMHLSRNDTLIADFIDTLQSDLVALGVPYQIFRRPLNEATLHIASPTGGSDTIKMNFHEGQALLVSKRWTVVQEGIIPFRNVIPVNMLGLNTVTDRSAQWAWLRDSSGFQLEVWNTHLEVLNAQIIGQAGEFTSVSDSLRAVMIAKGFSPSGRLFLGDINSVSKTAADSILTQAGWFDSWSETRWGPGFTYGFGSFRDSARVMTSRFDRILSQGTCGVDTAYLRGTKAVVTDSGPLFPSDHAMIVSKLRYGIRP